ncbi:hypothetical protein AB0M11_26485 [Streptomyces sp. NPDC051987]|uniref:hypothetical protein n=1 Tax=Streptomyces sp. NPDC051987 TaxID=3155808 RepID=UPI00343013A0
MEQRTHANPQEPSPSPWSPPPGRILSEPATVAQCRADYEAAADVRRVMSNQDARQR